MHDYYNLFFKEFWSRIHSLGEPISDIIRLRKGLLGDAKLTDEEREHAEKFLMTEEIKKYISNKKEVKHGRKAVGIFEGITQQLLENKNSRANPRIRNGVIKYDG